MPISCLSFQAVNRENEKLIHACIWSEDSALSSKQRKLMHAYIYTKSSQTCLQDPAKSYLWLAYVHTTYRYWYMKLLQFLFSTIKPDYKHYMNREPVRCWRKTKKSTISSQGHESGNVNHIKARCTSPFSFCGDLRHSSNNADSEGWCYMVVT